MFREYVRRAQAGDLKAFDALVERYQDAVCGTAFSMLGHFEDAQDVAQEAFIQAWRDLSSLREPDRFPGWLYSITRNRCRDLMRAGSRDVASVDAVAETLSAAPEAEPANHAVRSELRERVLAAIRSLSELNRLATTLFYINGYSVGEVAQFLETPVGTIKRRLHESRKRLKGSMMEMVRESLDADKPGPELRARIAAELQARRDQFDATIKRAIERDDTGWAQRWHGRRMEDVRANAAQYGLEPDEELPRMLPEYRQSETFRDDMKDLPRRWGIPEGLELVPLRDLCRDLLVSPLSIQRWQEQGMPALRYCPWVLYDRARVQEWLEAEQPEAPQPMDSEQARKPFLTVLHALKDGLATPEEGMELYLNLETAYFLGPRDPVWAKQWEAAHEREHCENAAQYGLSEPSDHWLGIPGEEARGNVHEMRDLTRRLGISPIELVRWMRQGMPCLRYSPLVRWDIRRVSAWLSEHGILPKHYTIQELDWPERFVCEAVAAGDGTPDEAHEAMAGWLGVM